MDNYKTSVRQRKKVFSNDHFRFIDAQRQKKILTHSVEKLNCRLQLLSTEQHKNMNLVKLYEKASIQITAKIEKKIINFQIRDFALGEQAEQIKIKKWQIDENKQKHQQILLMTKGEKNLDFQLKKEAILSYKLRIKEDLLKTQQSVLEENKHLYGLEKQKEQLRKKTIRNFKSERNLLGKTNYEFRVQQEVSQANQEKDRIINLERRENIMIQRLKITQELCLDSNQKLNDIKNKTFQDVIHHHDQTNNQTAQHLD